MIDKVSMLQASNKEDTVARGDPEPMDVDEENKPQSSVNVIIGQDLAN